MNSKSKTQQGISHIKVSNLFKEEEEEKKQETGIQKSFSEKQTC